jgi:glutamate-5-semialdehyde dehydrogenase
MTASPDIEAPVSTRPAVEPPDATPSVDVTAEVTALARRARTASRALATASRATKDAALRALADAIVAATDEILAANADDVERGRAAGTSPGLLDRLALTSDRIVGIADALRELAGLPDPVGEVVRGSTLPNGMRLRQVRVPMGIVGMIYEARPNVTVDAAGLALKSGNAVILRGGTAAASSNGVIVRVLAAALESVGLPGDLVQSIDGYGRAGAVALMHARGLVDVLVPRGGADLIRTVVREASVPVIETGVGNCHLYVDAGADVPQAVAILLNGKTQRVGVCNALETLLVHSSAAPAFLPKALAALADAGVTVHGTPEVQTYSPAVVAAGPDEFDDEYLSLDLACAVVGSLDEAIAHIRVHTTGHSETIITSDRGSADRFTAEVDAAAVLVNASSRFVDGGEFGFGAEIGIATGKFHARGPVGAEQLTTFKYRVHGSGQTRP